MISHLGRKPVRGGSPASESRVSINIALSAGVFVQVVISMERFRVLIEFRVRKTAAVIITYR